MYVFDHQNKCGYPLSTTGGLIKPIVVAICVFGLEWGMCYFLYKKKIFFKV